MHGLPVRMLRMHLPLLFKSFCVKWLRIPNSHNWQTEYFHTSATPSQLLLRMAFFDSADFLQSARGFSKP